MNHRPLALRHFVEEAKETLAAEWGDWLPLVACGATSEVVGRDSGVGPFGDQALHHLLIPFRFRRLTEPRYANAGGRDVFVSVIDAAGEQLWTGQFGSDGDEYTYGVATGPSGAAYVVGSTYRNFQGRKVGGSDAFIVQLVRP